MLGRRVIPLRRASIEPWHAHVQANEGKIWLRWLVRLRWVALFAQATTLAFVFKLLDGTVPIVVWVVVMALIAMVNLVGIRRLSVSDEVTAGNLFWHLLFDTAALTMLFFVSGGPANPFTPLLLVQVAMGAVMLPPRLAGTLTSCAILCLSLVHIDAYPLHIERHSLGAIDAAILGRWLAFAVTATSVAVFVVGLAASLRRNKERLLVARDLTARTDRLRSVGTLAAGAAHELNTPLSTIDLRARRLSRRHDEPDTVADVNVIRAQLKTCTSIVERLLIGAGDPSASDIEKRPLAAISRETANLWSKGTTLDIEFIDDSEGAIVELPIVAFQQALTNLLENAREAQEEVGSLAPLSLHVLAADDVAIVELHDAGCGLPAATDQVGEPFFTTKPAGTGLGVFVARAIADGAGGGLQYLARKPHGTTTRWWFPKASRSRFES